MKHQATKRHRGAHKTRSMPNAFQTLATVDVHERLSFFRSVAGTSVVELKGVSGKVRPEEAKPQTGDYLVNLLHPDDFMAICAQSALQGLVSARKIADEIRAVKPPNTYFQGVTAEVLGLGEYRGKIGVQVSYEGHQAEHEYLETALNRVLGTSLDMGSDNPLVPIAKGKLNALTNRAEVEQSLPAQLTLRSVIPLVR